MVWIMFRVKNKVIRTWSDSSVSLVDFEQVNVCWNVIKSLLNDFWSILKMLCSKCCSHLSNFGWCNALMELLLVICKHRHWNSALELELELELELILQTPLFPVPLGLWTPNLAGWWFRMRGPHPYGHVTHRPRDHVTNQKRYISTFTKPMGPQLSRLVTLDEGLHPQSYVTFDHVVTWQIKNVISPLSQGLWTPHLAEWCLRMRKPHPQSHVTLRHRGHLTNKKRYISTFIQCMDPKLSKVVTEHERNLPIKSRDTSVVWSRDKSKIFCLHFHKAQGPQT